MIIQHKSHTSQGSTFLACLCVAIVTGILLTSYLVLTHQQFSSVVRSEYWNRAITVAEAGVEDGLQMINKYSSYPGQLDNWNLPASLTADNWETYSNNCYRVTRYIGPDSYEAFIIVTGATPVVMATATIGLPFKSASLGSASPMFAAVGISASQVQRRVMVGTGRQPLYNVAMAALQVIDFNGKNVHTDSFDSAVAAYNTGGLYDPTKAKAGGDVATDGTIVNTLNIGNATINGHVSTGPNGTIAVGPNGSVGDQTWTASNTGIQPSWSADDMNIEFSEVKLPQNFSSSPDSIPNTSITVTNGTNVVTYNHYIEYPGGDYVSSDLDGEIYIAPGAKVRIHVTGDYDQKNDELLTIGSVGGNNGNLEIYVAGNVKIAGKGIINDSGNAANFTLYGLKTCTSINFAGNASFTGVIYAPFADFKLGGGGNDVYDFVGSSITKTVTMNGHYNFHYDENLRRVGPAQSFIPTWWLETKVN